MFKKISISLILIMFLSSCSDEENKQKSYDEIVTPALTQMNLESPPSHRELIAAGQLGGLLSPTQSVELDNNNSILSSINPLSNTDEEERMAFGQAIQDWNKHNYKQASQDFASFAEKYPNSPWKSEAILHMGCEARFNGRYSVARTLFDQVIKENEHKAGIDQTPRQLFGFYINATHVHQ